MAANITAISCPARAPAIALFSFPSLAAYERSCASAEAVAPV